MAHGLPTEVWSALYERICSTPALPLLGRIWREQWGPEGDISIAPDELSRLRAEITAFLPGVTDPASQRVLERLVVLIGESEAKGGGLVFEAE